MYLGKSIQTGKHGALEDAKTTMELYLLFRSDWEGTDEPFLLPPNQIRQITEEGSGGTAGTNTETDNHAPDNIINSAQGGMSHPRVGQGGENHIGLEDLEKFPDLSLK